VKLDDARVIAMFQDAYLFIDEMFEVLAAERLKGDNFYGN